MTSASAAKELISEIGRRILIAPPKISMGFEGGFFDRLLVAVLESAGVADRVRLFCSVRPCMSPNLVSAVSQYALVNGLELFGFERGCCVDAASGTFIDAQCSNVSDKLRALRTSGFLTHVIPTIFSDRTHTGLKDQSSNTEIGLISREDGILCDNSGYLLFPFMGFADATLIAAADLLLPERVGSEGFPVCIFSCYHEDEIKRFRSAYLDRQLIPLNIAGRDS